VCVYVRMKFICVVIWKVASRTLLKALAEFGAQNIESDRLSDEQKRWGGGGLKRERVCVCVSVSQLSLKCDVFSFLLLPHLSFTCL
jgi:hypothetical protein